MSKPEKAIYLLVIAACLLGIYWAATQLRGSPSSQCEQALAVEMEGLADEVIHQSRTVQIDGMTKQVSVYSDEHNLLFTRTLLAGNEDCFYVLVDSK